MRRPVRLKFGIHGTEFDVLEWAYCQTSQRFVGLVRDDKDGQLYKRDLEGAVEVYAADEEVTP